MLNLQQEVPDNIREFGIFNRLSKSDSETLRYFLSKEGWLIGRYFNCQCGHSTLSHENKTGECLIENCLLLCRSFIPREIRIKNENNFSGSVLSMEGFENLLRIKMIPIPERKTKIWWRLWEDYLGVFKDFQEREDLRCL